MSAQFNLFDIEVKDFPRALQHTYIAYFLSQMFGDLNRLDVTTTSRTQL